MQDARIVGLVPMKAHSERVPDKNIRDFDGEPLFHWILDTLTRSRHVDEVLVDTDSEVIAEQAPRRFDTVTIEVRPEEIRGDFVSMNRVLMHDVQQVEADYFLQTHATSPLLTAETVDAAVEAFLNSEEHDSLFTVTRLQTRLYDAEGEAINHDPGELLRTQDLPPVYEENSALYLFDADTLRERENRIGHEPMMYPIDPVEAHDIDEELDFRIAEFLHRERA